MLQELAASQAHRRRAALALAFLLALSATPPMSIATPVISAGNVPFSGISPGGVNMSTGELILVMHPDLVLSGPHPVPWRRYYASMLQREGLASSRLGPNWLGTYDWKLTVTPSDATLITNRGEAIRFAMGAGGSWSLVSPTYAAYKLDPVGPSFRFTNPVDRHIYFFDGATGVPTQILDEHGNALTLTYAAGGGPLTQVTDGLGRTLTFSYDATSGLLTQVSDGTRNVNFRYTGGVLSSFTDADGKPWSISRNPGPIQNLITGIHEPMGNTPVTHAYDPLGRVASQTDALSHTASYSYDTPTGNVFTDPAGNPWTYQHDPNKLTTLRDPNGGNTNFFYDPLGRLSSIARPMGDPTSFDYDPASGYVGAIHFADATSVSFDHGPHPVAGAQIFDVTAAHYPDGTNAIFNRDASGNLMTYLDQAGFPWNGTYNSQGQVLTWTNPGNGAATGTTTFTYDTQGRLFSIRDNAGNTTTYGYDPLGRVNQINWPGATHRQFTYDNRDNITLVGDEAGNPWSYAYDDNGRLMTATDPLLHATGYVYDDVDRVSRVVDPLGHATLYDYDLNGRLFHKTDRSGRTTTYQYDALNRLQAVLDPAGAPTSFGYDGDSRMIFTQDALGHSSSFQYDLLDRLTKVIDPVLSEFNYTHDAMGRVREVTGPLGFFRSFGYDPRGLLTSAASGSSVTRLQYTPHGQVSQITDPNSNVWPRSYDPQGRLMSASDPLGRAYGYQYDELGRLNLITRPDVTAEQIAYDAAGNVTGRSFTDGTAFTYGYDIANRMTSATGNSFTYDPAGRMTASNGFSYTHDLEGRILSETLSPGKTVSYTYDPRGLPSGVSDWLTGSTSFSYDAAHRFTGMTRANGTDVTYQYDNANRLISAVEKQPGPIQISSILVTRDALGRPGSIDRRQPLMPGATMPASSSFTYDIASQMNGVTHDPLGRATADGTRALGWNDASRLESYHSSSSADSLNFTDDPFKNPKKIAAHTGQVIQLAWGFGRGYPTNDDMVVSLPSRYRLHVRAPSGLMLYGVDGASGARSFYHYDERGNTAFLTNDGGNVTTEYAYGPFGGVSALGQTTDNPFTFGAGHGMLALASNGISTGLWHAGGGVYDERTMRMVSGLGTASGPQPHLGPAPHLGPIPHLTNPGPIQVGDPNIMPSQIGDPNIIGDPNQIGDPNLFIDPWLIGDPGLMPNGIGDPGLMPNMIGDPGITPQIGDPGIMPNGIGDPGIMPNQIGDPNISVALNPQPFPPAPGDGVALNPQPFPPAPAANPGPTQTGWKNPGPSQAGWKNPGPVGTPFVKFHFQTVFTTKIEWSSSDDAPTESITFVYGTLGVEYHKQNPAFELNDWSFPIENPTTIGSATAGAGGGKRKFNEFEITPAHFKSGPKVGNVNNSSFSNPCTWCPR